MKENYNRLLLKPPGTKNNTNSKNIINKKKIDIICIINDNKTTRSKNGSRK